MSKQIEAVQSAVVPLPGIAFLVPQLQSSISPAKTDVVSVLHVLGVASLHPQLPSSISHS